MRNSLLALLDKSPILGKSSGLDLSERISKIYKQLLSLQQHMTSINQILKSEINNESSTVFLEKKADCVQEYMHQGTVTETTINGLINVLIELVDSKLLNCDNLDVEFDEYKTKLEGLKVSETPLLDKLVSIISIINQVTLAEEFASYTKLKEIDDQ